MAGPSYLNTEEMLAREAAMIFPDAPPLGSAKDFEQAQRDLNARALCLSGGGVRSATFALGVIQGLAEHGLLRQFHYLSTVSGGGYIGGWLSRWIRSEQTRIAAAGQPDPRFEALAAVERDLRPGVEAAESRIRQLRDNALFLTPRTGIASPDLWTALAIVVRNILLNWLMIVPVLVLLAMAPALVLSFADALPIAATWTIVAIGTVVVFLSMRFTYAALPGTRASQKPETHAATSASDGRVEDSGDKARAGVRATEPGDKVMRYCAWPILLHSLLLSIVYVGLLREPYPELTLGDLVRLRDPLGPGCIWAPLWLTAVAGLIAVAYTEWRYRRDSRARLFGNLVVIVVIAYITLLSLALGVWLAAQVPHIIRAEVVIVAGPPWVMLASLTGAALYAGHRFIGFGGEFDREWLGRLSALKVMPTILWLVLGGTCLLLGPALLQQDGPVWDWIVAAAAAIAAASGPIAVVGGYSARTVAGAVASPQQRQSAVSFNVVVTVATFVFLLSLLLLLGWCEDRVARALYAMSAETAEIFLPHTDAAGFLAQLASPGMLLWFHVLTFTALLLLVLAANYRIKVNRFSLHALYRNRLMRGFLGSALPPRQRDSFTGFDFRDDVRMASLKADEADDAGKVHGLFHVVNVALNIAGSARGAQQERKAESFVLTPIACGSAKLDPDPKAVSPTGAYIASAQYGGNEPFLRDAPRGIHLATAMTISGAAANSSMGYNSSPATALLLTLFNVRLGCWLPNPAWRAALEPVGNSWRVEDAEYFKQSGPRSALRPLMTELAGRTSHRSKYLQLSDGGHFENLGIYEMVRRRCRFILVSDAECDGEGLLGGLGNAVRKCRIDFGVDIEFNDFAIASRTKGQERDVAYAVGRVRYTRDAKDDGILIYLKATFYDLLAFSRSMPADIRHYAAEHATFPHETTGDQWFSESQFESYRELGLALTRRMLSDLKVSKDDFAGFEQAAEARSRMRAATASGARREARTVHIRRPRFATQIG